MYFWHYLGVVLKKARKTGKGKCDASLPTGAVIDTLVVLSADLAEIVVKVDHMLFSCKTTSFR